MREVLFICTGNYYRSRFAEAFFNHSARSRGLPWRAFSRGLATHLVADSGDLSMHTRFALAVRGIALTHTGAKPVQLAAADLERAGLIIALKEAEHREMIRDQFPDWEDRVEYWHVHDLDAAGADIAVPEIETRTKALLDRIAQLAAETKNRPRQP